MKSKEVELITGLLLQLPNAKIVQGGRWLVCRCRYCGDSLNPNHCHFGIHIPQHENDVFYYNCFKCHTSSRLSTSDMISWGITNLEGVETLSKWNKRVLSDPRNRMYLNNTYYLNNTHISLNKLSEAKLNYINKRLGLNLSYTDLISNKIVLNLDDVLCENRVTKLTRDQRIVNQLSKCFLGFISEDNSFINMRRLVSEDKVYKVLKKRYINYNIFNSFDNTHRNYIIPNEILLDDPRPIQLIIAEGPFDILSIYYNVYNGNKYRKIFSSINGSSYLQLLENFIVKKGLINLDVHIFKDSDVSINKMSEIKQLLDCFHLPLTVHQNSYPGEKDFGVKKEKIKDNIIYIG